MKKAPNITLNPKAYIRGYKCLDCGHVQDVEPARVVPHTDDPTRVHAYCGSRDDHCDKCDGPVQLLPKAAAATAKPAGA